MKKFTLVFLSLLLTGLYAVAELHVIQKKDKFGFADENETVVIKPQFKSVTPFANGVAKVQKGDKWGYIDETGKAIIPIQFDDIDQFNANGIALVKKGNKKGYIRQDGTFLVKPDFNFIGGINDNGYIWVAKGKTIESSLKGLYKLDKLILPVKYLDFGFYQKTDSADYSDGHAFGASTASEIKKNLCKLSDSDIPYIWTSTPAYKRGITDLEGKPVVKEMLYAMGAPKDGRVLMIQYGKKKNKYNYLVLGEKSSNKLFKKDLEKAVTEDDPENALHPFNNGIARVCLSGIQAHLIDTEGNKISSDYNKLTPLPNGGFIAMLNASYSLLDAKGSKVGTQEYKAILAPSNDGTTALAAKNADGKCGFIDFNANPVSPFIYEDAAAFCYGRGYVKSQGKWGVTDDKFNFIAQPRWDVIKFALNEKINYVWVQENASDKWECLELIADRKVPSMTFEEVSPFDEDGMALVKSDGKYAMVDFTGNFPFPAMFTTPELCKKAKKFARSEGKNSMSGPEAYRFNIYNNPERHKYRLHQRIDKSMWDY